MTTESLLKQAESIVNSGENLMRALDLLRQVEQRSRGAPYDVERRLLENLGRASYNLGRLDDALMYFRTLGSLARRQSDAPIEAYACQAVLLAKRKQMEEWPEPGRFAELLAESRECLVLADKSGDAVRRARAHRSLADLLAADVSTRETAESHYRLALTLSRAANSAWDVMTSEWALGRYLAMFGKDLHEATRLIDDSVAAAVTSRNPINVVYAWRQKMRLGWRALARDQAIIESRRALDAIERLASAQSRDRSRAEVTSAWTPDYYWLAGHILRVPGPTRTDVTEAFDIVERMRARMLLDSLHASRTAAQLQTPEAARRQTLLGEITVLQQELLKSMGKGPAEPSILRRLELLEREEEALRAVIAERSGSGVAQTGPIALAALERLVREDEALLSFAVGIDETFYRDFDGGSWLFVVTSSRTRVVRIPDRITLHPIVSVYRGLVENPSHTDHAPSITLYDLLLKEALASLPSTVRRLILIPDGPLHHLPFSALRPAPDASPLGQTHELLIAPSASVWTRLKQYAPPSATGATLVLADPAFNRGEVSAKVAAERGWSLDAMPAGSLPHARREGRAVLAHMPRTSRLLEGADASEASLKRTDANAYGVLHFAAHALVDERHPDRSAVILAGSAEEDGLLQAREIADLSLRGRVVVLSACRSATGAVLGGEGVLGLSRSFFEAGARTVIGTLWPIRDDHAATFVEFLFEGLGRGGTVGAAVTAARIRAADAGLPASAWSSFVVIGDDDVVVVRDTDRSGGSPLSLVGVAVLAVVAVVLAWWRGVAWLAGRRRAWSIR